MCIIIWMLAPSRHQACTLASETPIGMIDPLKNWNISTNKEGFMGKVIVGSKQEPLCIPGNSTITVPGVTKNLAWCHLLG